MNISEYPNHFQLFSYHEAVEHSAVVNVGEFGTDIWLHLPPGSTTHLSNPRLYVIDCNSNIDPVDCEITKDNHSWFSIPTSKIDLTPGFHMYCIEFEDTIDTVFRLYFCYHTQTNTPVKDYIYMNRNG